MLAGCGKNEVTLTFQLSQDVNTPCRILYYASSKNVGMIRETVAEIAAGKGEVALPQKYPSIIYLFSPSQKQPEAIIYAKSGDKFVISGKGPNIGEWEITGNDVTEALSEWRIRNSSLIRSADEDKLNKAVSEYVVKNPDSKAAAIILYVYFVRRGHEKEFESLQKKLSRDIYDDEKLMAALSSADLMTNLTENARLPEEIIRVGADGFADTLFIKDGKGKFLIFNDNSHSERTMPADSVAALTKRKTDRKVAEFYMESDSLSWQRHVKADTIPGLTRLWMPQGMADTTAISMGIRRVPYFVVVDAKGQTVYSGDNWKEAEKKFDSLKP